jgi:hypothetical protein
VKQAFTRKYDGLTVRFEPLETFIDELS